MELNRFIIMYANTPLKDRNKPLSKDNPMTLDGLYQAIKRVEEEMRPLYAKQNKYLEMADTYFWAKGKRWKIKK